MESNFQHPLARARAPSRSCSLNRNEPGDAIETTRNSLFDNETIFTQNSKEPSSREKFS